MSSVKNDRDPGYLLLPLDFWVPGCGAVRVASVSTNFTKRTGSFPVNMTDEARDHCSPNATSLPNPGDTATLSKTRKRPSGPTCGSLDSCIGRQIRHVVAWIDTAYRKYQTTPIQALQRKRRADIRTEENGWHTDPPQRQRCSQSQHPRPSRTPKPNSHAHFTRPSHTPISHAQ